MCGRPRQPNEAARPRVGSDPDPLAPIAAFATLCFSDAGVLLGEELATRLHHVVSHDGAKIAYWRSGTGPPLVLVHGSPADHTAFSQLIPHLEPAMTVCAMDRRGRGPSEDGPSYSHEREFEDVAAVVDALGPQVDLFGHSYGGVCALEASRLSASLRRLVLYEPWIGRYPEGVVDKLQEMADAGDSEGVLLTILRDVASLSDADIDTMRALPSWEARLAVATVTAREVRVEDAYSFHPERFAGVTCPTLLLVGEHSPPEMRATAETISAALADCRIEVLSGQQHTAHLVAPELLASTVLSYLS